jgi:ATP-dependent RNA helicase DHX37/DHR1
MTQYDGLDEEKEIKRLRSILKCSEKHLRNVDDEGDTSELPADGENKKRKRKMGSMEEANVENSETSMFSKEFLEEQGYGEFGTDDNPMVVMSKKKKKKDKKAHVYLTAEEIKEARILQKKTARKLEQLEIRAAQKKKRAQLYKKLQEDQAAQADLQPLLLASGKLSRKETDTKKQAVKKIFNKEQAGLSLTMEEKDLLFPERTVRVVDNLTSSHSNNASMFLKPPPTEDSSESKIGAKKDRKAEGKKSQSKQEGTVEEISDSKSSSDAAKKSESIKAQPFPAKDFAAQMMASLSTLKTTSKEKAEAFKSKQNEVKSNIVTQQKDRYIPSNPTILKTAAMMGLQPSDQSDLKREVIQIKRPEEVEKKRCALPVTAMEFEIMDAIRNNDVTIICGETGSGKSTQIPAYVYEGGMCNSPGDPRNAFVVGVTQPRRVAAVSTAKRICYELGQGDGQSIKGSGGKGNLVGYKTRFESAGCGESTRIQFMTDGILLSEIQNDLLLRRYSVIVLDESHERNLNTDVLIGLLSVALPLRKKAAEEDPTLPPLKLVLMSATLRVEDFTKNVKLFPTGPPKVVTVPGRTHPVTIHHSKVTELDDYGTYENLWCVKFRLD